jgi:hypothetical protein
MSGIQRLRAVVAASLLLPISGRGAPEALGGGNGSESGTVGSVRANAG